MDEPEVPALEPLTPPDRPEDFSSALGKVPKSESEKDRGIAITPAGEDSEFDMASFEEDIFSLMIVADTFSLSFLFSLTVFGFQILMLSLIIIDLLEDDELEGDDNNTLNVPVEVDWQVSVAQVLALIVAIVSQEDVRTTLQVISIGYDPSIVEKHPGATRSSFYIANMCRIVEGLLGVFVAFVFIVQSDNILDIFMNFAAVEFISNLDNLAYELAVGGYVGSRIKKNAEELQDVQFPVSRPHLIWLEKAIFYLLIVALFAGWAVIFAWQEDGTLLERTSCGSFSVHFGDEVLPFGPEDKLSLDGVARPLRQGFNTTLPPDMLYAYFSGSYLRQIDSGDERPKYYESKGEEFLEDPTSGRFYYCDSQKAWAFSIPALGTLIPDETKDACGEWGFLMLSQPTESFTLEEAPQTGWRIWSGTTLVESPDFFAICAECNNDIDCGVRNGVCDDTCTCKTGFAGPFCGIEIPTSCRSLTWLNYFEKSSEFQTTGPYDMSLNENGVPYTVYDRPVFRLPTGSIDFNGDGEIDDEVLLFVGRRWLDTYWNPSEIETILLSPTFHAYWDNVLRASTVWFSDPTNSDTPIGFTWNAIRWSYSLGESYSVFGASYPVNVRLECAAVNCNADPCGIYGRCFNNTCHCDDAYGGFFCEFAPGGPYAGEQWADILEYFELSFNDDGSSTIGANFWDRVAAVYNMTEDSAFIWDSEYAVRWFNPVLDYVIDEHSTTGEPGTIEVTVSPTTTSTFLVTPSSPPFSSPTFVSVPAASPIASPVSSPVASPIAATTAPSSILSSAPTAASSAPTSVSAPASSPIASPVSSPIASPVAVTSSPSSNPTVTSSATPSSGPTLDSAPISPPFVSPAAAPLASPLTPSVGSPVAAAPFTPFSPVSPVSPASPTTP